MSAIIHVTSQPFRNNNSLSLEQAVECKRMFAFSVSRGKIYKDALLAEISKGVYSVSFKEGMLIGNIKHYLGELINIGEYINTHEWRMGLTFSDCAKVSRGGHNRKKDIAKEDRVLHTLTCELLRKRFDVTLPDTWAAQTCFIRDNADGQKALSLAKKMIKEELKNK